MAGALVELFRHNRWANLRLLDLCAGLDGAVLNASAPGTYGRVRDTLAHLVGAEERYVAFLTNRPLPDPTQSAAGPQIAELRARAEHSGTSLIGIAERFRATRVLRGTWRGEPYTMPAVIPLIQAINHATEHRAHIMTILSQQGVTPPSLDGWTYDEARAER